MKGVPVVVQYKESSLSRILWFGSCLYSALLKFSLPHISSCMLALLVVDIPLCQVDFFDRNKGLFSPKSMVNSKMFIKNSKLFENRKLNMYLINN